MSHTNAAALRTTYWVFQIGSKLARSACGTKRNTRAAARCEIAGVASAPAAVRTPAPAAALMNVRRCITAGPRATSNRLVHSPKERQRPLRNPADVLAPGKIPKIHAERDIDHVVERGLVQPARNKPLLVERPGIVPSRDLGFDFRDIRPSKKCFVAIGAKELVGGVDAVDAVKARVKNVPAAMARRGLLRPPRDHGAPIDSRIVNLDAKAGQQVRGHITPGLVVCKILRRHGGDRLARIIAVCQQTLGCIEIAWAFENFAAFLGVE